MSPWILPPVQVVNPHLQTIRFNSARGDASCHHGFLGSSLCPVVLGSFIYNLRNCLYLTNNTGVPTRCSISMDRNVYKNDINPYFSYRKMKEVLEYLISKELITLTRGYNNRITGESFLSTIAPTDSLNKLLLSKNPSVRVYVPKGTIAVRAQEGEILALDKFDPIQVREITSALQLINYNNNKHTYSYKLSSYPSLSPITQITVLDDVGYNRVFNTTLSLGGRFYSPIQNLTGVVRMTLLIDGQKTVEVDYGGMHPRMVYHLKGLIAPQDVYDVGLGAEYRKIVKLALLIVFNASSRSQALNALKAQLDRDGIDIAGVNLGTVFDQIEKAHAGIASVFYSGRGLELQALDARVAEEVMLAFAGFDKPCLGIHDSFVVKAEDEQLLRDLMISCYQRVINTNFIPVVK